MPLVFVLIHSPLVSPSTWSHVAAELRLDQIETVVPALADDNPDVPYWRQHVDSVVRALENMPPDRSLVLVGHSGAGALLPSIGEATNQQIAGYIFVDAGIPTDGATRLDAFATEDPE